jgi:ribonucleoside-diphosphate reductase subunit M2
MSVVENITTPVSKTTFAIADMGLNTPLKVDLVEKLVAPVVEEVTTATTTTLITSPTITPEEEPIEDFRLRFVGEVDIDEKDEPLLKESQRRFVLFPIQYHEVCLTLVIIVEEDTG